MTDPYRTTDWAHWLAAIRTEPGCDTLRLQAADWLEEHGDPLRAEFIRVQCGAHSEGRENALLNHVFGYRYWLQELGFGGPSWGHWHTLPGTPTFADDLIECTRIVFRRGFPQELHCTLTAWPMLRLDLVHRQPICTVALSLTTAMTVGDWWKIAHELRHFERVELGATPLVPQGVIEHALGRTQQRSAVSEGTGRVAPVVQQLGLTLPATISDQARVGGPT